jgi:hypothetical protein
MLPWIRLQTNYLIFCALLSLVALFTGTCLWYESILIFVLLSLSDWVLSSINPYSSARKALIFLGFFLMPGTIFLNGDLRESIGTTLLLIVLGLASAHFSKRRNWLPLVLLPSLFLGLIHWQLALIAAMLAFLYLRDRSDESWLWSGALILPPILFLILDRENLFKDSSIAQKLLEGFQTPWVMQYDWGKASEFALIQHQTGDYNLFLILGVLIVTGLCKALPVFFRRLLTSIFVSIVCLSIFSPLGLMPSGLIYLGILCIGTILMQPDTVKSIRGLTVFQKLVLILLVFFGLMPLYSRTGW